MPDLSVEQFQSLSQQIYQKLGLQFEDKKIYFLKTRVAKRMAALGIDDPRDYVFLVCYADPKGKEMQALANLITTNETYMFREFEQLEAFANCCLPEVLSAKQARGEQNLRIWSAGCSSGEEPYTLAMILQEVFPQSQYWDCEIVATDIDQNVLAQADRGTLLVARSVQRSACPHTAEKHLIQEGDATPCGPASPHWCISSISICRTAWRCVRCAISISSSAAMSSSTSMTCPERRS